MTLVVGGGRSARKVAGSVLVVLGVVAALALISARTAQAAGEYELNDSYNTAYGPISSGTSYTAGFETQNDVDHYYFYLPSLTQVRYNLAVPSGNELGVALDIEHADLDGGADSVSDLYVRPGQTGSGAVTLERGKYFVVFCGAISCNDEDVGDRYTFRLDPAGITSTYEPFATACANAHPAVELAAKKFDRVRAKLGKTRNRLQTAKSRRHRGKARRLRKKVQKLKTRQGTYRSEFKAAAAAEEAACSVPQ